jgi:hypothetical protein
METEKTIEERLKKRLGEGFDMRFEYLDEISRGPGGKLKTIVSALKKGAQRL